MPSEVWDLTVSGLQVVRSWLGYRMRDGAGRKSSPLDDIRPEGWTAELDQELLELLWVLEATVDLFPQLENCLNDIVASDLFTSDDLPKPSLAERKPPDPSEGFGQGDLAIDPA